MAQRGRPQTYSPAYIKKAEKYLAQCTDGYRRVLKSKKARSVMYAHERVIRLPNIGGLAVYLDIARDTIYDWKKKHPDFSYIVEKILAEQENRLVNGGISGDYNATISKVMMTKHGYREGHDLSNPDGSNLFRPSDKDKSDADRALGDM